MLGTHGDGSRTVPVSPVPLLHTSVSYEYDKLGRVVKETDALGQSATAEYDNLGNRIKTTDRSGVTTTYTYDGLGRMTSRSAGGQTETWTYNLMGLVSRMTDASGTTGYEYDGFGRLTKETHGSIIKTYTYDANGNRTAFELKNVTEVVWEETNAGGTAYIRGTDGILFSEQGSQKKFYMPNILGEFGRK